MSLFKQHFPVRPQDFSAAGEASAQIKNFLKQLGAGSAVIRRAAILSYEAELNLIIHSLGGEMVLEVSPEAIVITTKDVGPGIPDISLALTEGWSTAPDSVREMGFGAGMGLPNMKRNADAFDISSEVGVGTEIVMTIRQRE